MSLPWRKTLDASLAAHGDDPSSRYLALATNGLDGYPANRMLVFRGFTPDGGGLLFATDLRSRKARELRWSVEAEACWYFHRTREQYRIRGDVAVIRDSRGRPGELRESVWKTLSGAVRKQFTWPKSGQDWVDDPPAAPPDLSDLETPSDNFAVLRLMVFAVDYLDLRQDPPIRERHEYSAMNDFLHVFRPRSPRGGWTFQRINP